MAQSISLIVLKNADSKVKQIHFSFLQLSGLIAAVVVGIGLAIYGCIDYFLLKPQMADKRELEIQLSEQSTAAALQHEQIQKFATEINELKMRMVALNEFEERIRVLANLDQQDAQEGIFGIGGSAPDDMNAAAAEALAVQHPLFKEMHLQVDQLDGALQKRRDSFLELLDELEEQKNVLAHTPSIRPAKGLVTSAFSYRKSPFTGNREFHKGIDIANQLGTSIWATADGVVSFVGANSSFGQMLVIDHGYGITTRYGHLQKTLKTRGDHVLRGDAIALMGNTGRSTGPHLHYEIRINGVPVNPKKYIHD